MIWDDLIDVLLIILVSCDRIRMYW